MQPPHNGGFAIASGFADDDIREIGDRIAELTNREALELSAYLEMRLRKRHSLPVAKSIIGRVVSQIHWVKDVN